MFYSGIIGFLTDELTGSECFNEVYWNQAALSWYMRSGLQVGLLSPILAIIVALPFYVSLAVTFYT